MVVNIGFLRRQRIHSNVIRRVGYQSRVRISILRWMIELGRINIITKVLLLPSYVALPREGHLEAAVHVIAHFFPEYHFCAQI